MKRNLIALIMAGCMITLCACNVNINTGGTAAPQAEDAGDKAVADDGTASDEQVPEETADTGNEDSVKEISPDANGVLAGDLFSVTVPADVTGYVAFSSPNGIELCDKEARDAGFGGYVFSIQAYKNPGDYAGGLDTKKGEIHSQDEIYDVTITQATDVQWDYEKYTAMPESYEKIYKSMDDIVNSIKPAGGGEYIAGAGTKGEDLYGDVIEQFKTAISEGWDANKLEENGMSSMYYAMSQYENAPDVMKVTGYAYTDMNSDGIDELAVGEITEGEDKGLIYDIYTMIDRKPAHVVSGYPRDRYYALNGGLIVNEASGGADLTEVVSYYITPNSTELIPQIAVKYDAYENKDNPWFVSFSYEEGEWDKISEDEFNEYLGRMDDIKRLDFTPFAN